MKKSSLFIITLLFLSVPAMFAVSTAAVEIIDISTNMTASASNHNIGLHSVNDFISRWSTFKTSLGSTSDNVVKLPLEATGTYNFLVDWGDGKTDTITVYDQLEVSHVYDVLGTYDITISGTLIGFSFQDMGDNKKIVEISQWGSLTLGNSTGYFDGCANLVLSATDAPDLTGTTTLEAAFRYADKLGNTGSMATWNVSQVTDMNHMFYRAIDFNMSLNSWDTGNVVDMSYVLSRTDYYNQPMDAWNVSSVTNMDSMFYQAISFNQSLNSWDVSAVTNMYTLFGGASNFNHPLDNWDVSSVLDMRNVFSLAVSFNQPLNTWDVSGVTNLAQMFYSASSFNQPLDNWDVSNVLYMERVFKLAINFNQVLNTWDVSSVTNMAEMFYSASSFNQPLDAWNVSQVTRMSSTFYFATAFDQNIASWNVESVQYMSQMFREATLSPQNYGALIIGWSKLDLKTNVYFHGGFSRYLSDAAASRQVLIDTFSWSIIDGGLTTLPEVSHPIDTSYVVGTTGNTIVWTVGVNNPDVYNITMDGLIYSVTQSWTNGSIILDIDGLSIGTYEFIIYLYDLAGKMNYDTVIVTVVDLPDIFDPSVSSPADIEYIYGSSGNQITWTVGDANPGVYNVTKNGTIYRSTQSWSSSIISLDIDGLVVGVHEIILYVYDLNGNKGSDIVIVRVTDLPDIIDPSVTSPADIEYIYGSSGNQITWTVGDANPGVYNVTKNGTIYHSTQSWSSSLISLDIDGLVVGVHEFILYVYDFNGNKGSDTVLVIVTLKEKTTTTLPSTSTSSSTSTIGSTTSNTTESVIYFPIVIISIGVISVVIKRRK